MIDLAACCYLLHATPPPGVGGRPELFFLTPDGERKSIGLRELGALEGPVVTHSFHYLVEWLRSEGTPLPSTVVDLESAERLCMGARKGDLRRPYPWQLGQMLLRRRGDDLPESFARGVGGTLESVIAGLAREDPRSLYSLSKLIYLLPNVWRSLAEELRTSGEWSRFFDIEIPVFNLLLKSQYEGLRLDSERFEETVGRLEDQYFALHRRLAIDQRVDVGRALRDIVYLHGLLGHGASEFDVWRSPIELLRAKRKVEPLCSELYDVFRLRQDRRILMRALSELGDQGRVHVQYESMGTVTGRVLSVNPRLQNLSRKSRGLVVPSEGCCLTYLDFSQFEPTILASLSRGEALIQACATGDFYEDLALKVFGQEGRRSLVKSLFLPYLYGMSFSALVPRALERLDGLEFSAQSFERQFGNMLVTVERWKRAVYGQLGRAGRIGSLNGNFRYRVHYGDLDARERRWAISQIVQGTGSLILKEWMIAIAREEPGVSIRLPMHDALLLEMPIRSSEESEDAVKRLGERAFSKYCPGVPVFLAAKKFAD